MRVTKPRVEHEESMRNPYMLLFAQICEDAAGHGVRSVLPVELRIEAKVS